MNITTAPAVAQLGKFRSKLEASEAEGFKGQMTQLGINMVDLMMWLVIAALLLAAALQGIGYYQQAAWTYQAKADVSSVRTYMETQFTLNNNTYPAVGTLVDGRAASPANDNTGGNLKLTAKNKAEVTASGTGSWAADVKSDSLQAAGKSFTFVFDSTTGNNPQASGVSTDAW